MVAQRIASLLASGTEILYALGLGEWVVAVSHECDYPHDVRRKPRVTRTRVHAAAPSGKIDEQVRRSLSAGAALYQVDVDRLAALRPELIVTQAHCDVCAVDLDEVKRAVAGVAGLQDAVIVSLNPVTLEGIFADVRRVADGNGRGKWTHMVE